jgi:hypothetical protein
MISVRDQLRRYDPALAHRLDEHDSIERMATFCLWLSGVGIVLSIISQMLA